MDDMPHNRDSIFQQFMLIHGGKISNCRFSHANVVMLSREEWAILADKAEKYDRRREKNRARKNRV